MNISYKDIVGDDFIIYYDHAGQSDEEGLNFGARSLPEEEILEFLRILLIVGLRIGYLLVQIGSIPVENVYIILYHNIIEIAVSIFSFITVGMAISTGFNMDRTKQLWGQWKSKNQEIITDMSAGLMAVLTGSAQMSTFLVGRIHVGGAVLLTALYCGIVQPLLMFLVWHQDNWIKGFASCLSKQSKRNAGFAHVVHVPSSLLGLVGALVLGRRLLRVRDLDEFSFGGENVILTAVGYLLIILGYFALSLPTDIKFLEKDIVVRLVSSVVATSTGILMVSVLYHFAYKEVYKYWIILRMLQGGIAGLMVVSSAVICVADLWIVTLMAVVGASAFFFCALVMHNTALEDYCNMASSHLLCAFLGVLFWQAFHLNLNEVLALAMAAVGTVLFGLVLFFALNACGILRNKYEAVNHRRATNVRDNLPDKGFLQRLFMIDDLKTPHILPGNYRKRFMPDPEKDIVSKDVKTVTIAKIVKDKDVPKKKKGTFEFDDDQSRAMGGEGTLLFPLPSVGGKKNVPGVGAGDHYDAIKL